MANPPAQPYHGDFVAWSGGCVLIGEGGDGTIEPHAHYAIQLCFAVPAGLRIRFGRHGAWQACAAALVPSRATHTIDFGDRRWGAVVFVEPETREGRALSARLGGALECLDAAAIAPALERLHGAWTVERDIAAVAAACHAFVQQLSGTVSREPSDLRVLQAVEFIRQRLDDAPSLEALAGAVHLSPSRFRHLFVEETGMPMRTYVLWRRRLRVWSLLMEGETLSGAAHAAGFADSAHLSRTARTMFGLAPSMIRMAGPLSERVRAGAAAGGSIPAATRAAG
jgi:AraC-like DNA-binding protein